MHGKRMVRYGIQLALRWSHDRVWEASKRDHNCTTHIILHNWHAGCLIGV